MALRAPVALVAVLTLPVARALPVKPSGAWADPSAQPRSEGGDQATFLASIALPDNAVEVSSVSPAAEGARDEMQREVSAVNEALQSVGSSLQFDPDLLASKVRAGYGPKDALQDSEAAVTEAAQAEIGRAFRIAFKPIFKEVSESAELRAFIDMEILQHKDDAIEQVKTTAVPMAIMAAVPLSVLVAAVLGLVYRAGYDQGQNSHVVRRLEQFLAGHEGEGAEREPDKAPGGPVAERGSAARGFFPASGSVDLRPSLASIRDSLAAPAPPSANSWRWSQSVSQLWGGATALAPPAPRATLI